MAKSENPNKKKHHLRRWIIFGVVVTILVAPIALAFGFLYDNSTSSFERDPNFNKDEQFKIVSVDSLDRAKTDHVIDYSISENTFNNLIALGFDNVDPMVKSFIKKTSAEFNKNEYMLSAEVDLFGFFRSRLYIYTEIQKENINNEIVYVFKINNIVIGRASHLYGLSKDYLSKYINNDVIKQVFSSFGFNITPDLANSRVLYSEKNLLSDMNNLIGRKDDESGSDKLFYSIIDEYIDRDSFNFNLNKEHYIGGTIDISAAKTNLTYCSDEKLNEYDFDIYRSKAKDIMESGIMPNPDLANSLFSYLVNGHDRSSDSVNNFVKDLDLSSIGISDKETYQGIPLPPKVDIISEARDDANSRISTIPLDGIICRLDETKFDGSLATQSLFGHTYTLSRRLEDNSVKLNYIVVDNFYSNIIDNHFVFVVQFNINGYPNTVVVDAIADNEDVGEYKMSFSVNDIYYGNELARNHLKEELYTLITDSVKNEDWVFVSFNDEKKQMIIDLSTAIDPAVKSLVASDGKTGKIRVKGESKDSNGYLEVYAE